MRQADQALTERAAHYIDEICQRWAGLGRDQALQGLAMAKDGAHKRSGLPTWLDPEDAFPAEHPLRALRQEMQAFLLATRPEWESLEEPEKARARLAWLEHYCARGGELAQQLKPHLSGEMARFSAVRYWLTGARA